MVVLYENLPNALPADDLEQEVEESEATIDGPDGNKIKLYIKRPRIADSRPPAQCDLCPRRRHDHATHSRKASPTLAQIHRTRRRRRHRRRLPQRWTSEGVHNEFPAGLKDCAAAVKYISAHRFDLGISTFILQGESGGANLFIATAMKGSHEGWIDDIAGVCALVPYIAVLEGYGWTKEKRAKELPSLVEDNGYFLHTNLMNAMAYYYQAVDEDLTNPLAWPYHAIFEDLKGLLPFVVSVDELDLLRDEGIAYLRKLLQADVRASGDMNLGILHGSAMFFRQAIPDMHWKAVRQIASFAKSLEREGNLKGLKIGSG
ncbi:hypothetical protein DOTSEDRAFT_45112 [Dothistroma septosporum NZE10]|uniref:Alpha/beta hydrolase fold-3 domain-containing protein n=1 Tax=Dothistroma septosporum (strain NZE10 / CBS 128990) TaxID=675120 RepID=M2YMH2_DOTSN|nr:hypothetical protein DOTSEDRAFT_45112 [Dothistroma septosporum NZE10]